MSAQKKSPDASLQVAVVCVADSSAKYLYQAFRFVHSIKQIRSRHSLEPIVGYFDGAAPYFLEGLERLGAALIRLDRYSLRHGPSNKMAILRSSALTEYDTVVMADCDVVFVDQFDELCFCSGFQGKLADQKTLPDSILENVFRLAGRTFPAARFTTTLDLQPTVLYCNAGLLIFSGQIFKAFVERWFFWNDLILRNQHVMERLRFFTDQASLCLTAEEFADDFVELGVEMNYPLHLDAGIYPSSVKRIKGKVLHYHDAVDPKSGLLDLTRLQSQHPAIIEFNQTFLNVPNLTAGPAFWDFLHTTISSREDKDDEFRNYRQGLVRRALEALVPSSVLDLGCGRTPLVDGRIVASYHGFDYSSEAITEASRNDPLGNYVCTDITTHSFRSAELVLLIDVLPYCYNGPDLLKAINHASEASTGGLFISGLSHPLMSESRPSAFFHMSIEEALERLTKFEFRKVGSQRDQDFFLGVRR